MGSLVRAARGALVFGLVVGSVMGGALAQENLYGPAAPPDAAYLRVANARPGEGEVEASLGELNFAPVAFTEVTPYRVVTPGPATLRLDGTELDLTVEAGEFYTVVAGPEGATALNDEPLIDASRALLTLYNLASLGPLDLKTADGATEVVTGVAPGAADGIVVNQAEVPLAVFSGPDLIGELGPRLLERGVAYSVMVFDGDAGPVVAFAPAELQE